jgi:hypothetical protein
MVDPEMEELGQVFLLGIDLGLIDPDKLQRGPPTRQELDELLLTLTARGYVEATGSRTVDQAVTGRQGDPRGTSPRIQEFRP